MTWAAYKTNAADIPAKGYALDLQTKAIRKAYQLAKRDGKPWFVGASYQGPYLTLDEGELVLLGNGMFKVETDGTVSRKETK